MLWLKTIVSLSVLFLLTGCATTKQMSAKVRVQLSDGQVLVGALTTPAFALGTDFGKLNFRADDAGELSPLEGEDVERAGSFVRLWLRDGSEFVGEWHEADVKMEIQVGGKAMGVQVPISKLKRLRFQGRPVWADAGRYRVRTRRGDDFFVDPKRSRLKFVSDLGTFSPLLSEIEQLDRDPAGGDSWKVQLKTGTRIHGHIAEDGFDLHPVLGPERLTLTADLVERVEQVALARPAHLPVGGASEYYDNSMQKSMKQQIMKH